MIVRTWRTACVEKELDKVREIDLGSSGGHYYITLDDGSGTAGSSSAAEIQMEPGELDQLIEELQSLKNKTPAPTRKIRYIRNK